MHFKTEIAATTFDLCMSYLPLEYIGFPPSHSKEIYPYVLSCATKLATTSKHYVLLSEKEPDKEAKEMLLLTASQLAKLTNNIESHLEIFYAIFKTNIDYNKMIEIAGNEITEIMLITESFDEIERILNIIDTIKMQNPYRKFIHADLQRIAIETASTKSKVSFIYKDEIAEAFQIDNPKTIALAMAMINLVRNIKRLEKETEKSPKDYPLKNLLKKLNQK